MKTVAALAVVVCLAVPLAACGRKASPVPPPGAVNDLRYPARQPGDEWSVDQDPGAYQRPQTPYPETYAK